MTKESLGTYYEELGKTLGEALIAPTKIYVKALKAVKDAGVAIKACSHITGGGFYENIPRMLPEGVRAFVKKDSYEVPAIFRLLASKGNIDEQMMYNTYNMGNRYDSGGGSHRRKALWRPFVKQEKFLISSVK